MRPIRKQDAAPRPALGYAALRQVRRVHLRAGRDTIKAEYLRRAVDGLQQQSILLHGHQPLLPRRKFLLSLSLRSPSCDALPPLRHCFLLCRTHCPPACASDLAYASVAATGYGGVSTKHPTPKQLEALSAGDRCEIYPRQSKCDATGKVWGDRTIALAYVDVPGNAAKALAYLKLAFPVEASARESVPFLTADNATSLTPSQADKLLASLLSDTPSHLSPVPMAVAQVAHLLLQPLTPHTLAATITPFNVAVGSEAYYHQLARAASALASASVPAASAQAPTAAAAFSCPFAVQCRHQSHCCPSSTEHAAYAPLPPSARAA
eukprot:2382958-Pleurochrysis_carterae.AAC.1